MKPPPKQPLRQLPGTGQSHRWRQRRTSLTHEIPQEFAILSRLYNITRTKNLDYFGACVSLLPLRHLLISASMGRSTNGIELEFFACILHKRAERVLLLPLLCYKKSSQQVGVRFFQKMGQRHGVTTWELGKLTRSRPFLFERCEMEDLPLLLFAMPAMCLCELLFCDAFCSSPRLEGTSVGDVWIWVDENATGGFTVCLDDF